MITLTALHNDWLTTATTPTARRLWRTWTHQHEALAAYPDAATASTTARRSPNPAPVLNAVLALAADHPLARHAILDAYLPWIGRHLRTHPVDRDERDDQIATLVTTLLDTTVALAPDAPYEWPATQIVNAMRNPLRAYYRALAERPEPLGGPGQLDRYALPLVTIPRGNTQPYTGEELAIAALAAGVATNTIRIDDANLVARMITDGASAQSQAPRLFIAQRTAQHRARTIALHLAADAA
jgi:hypothetical protein